MRTVYFDIDDKTEDLKHRLTRDKEEAARFEERFEVSWIFHENAIEGQVMDVFDLKAALDHATGDDGILIPTYQRIRNHKTAIETVRLAATSSSRPPALNFLKNLHVILTHGLAGQQGGVYRREIPIHRSYFHDIAAPQRIPALMSKLVQDLKGKEFRQFHPFRQAAEAHFRFMSVFPFDEDTGKVGRLLLNFYLIRAGYYPVIIPDVERQRYYEALRVSPEVIHSIIVESMERQLDAAIRALGA